MIKDVIRLTYRLPKTLYIKIADNAKKRNISVNAEINRVLYAYYIENKKG